MSHPLLEGLDGLTGVVLRQRLVEARAAALAFADGDESHPVVTIVRSVEDDVVRAMREGIASLVHGMQPPSEEPAPAPAPVPAPAPRPPMRRVPAPTAAAVLAPVPAPRPPTPGGLAGLRKAPADDGPPETPEPPVRPVQTRTPLPRVQPLPGYRPPPPPPPLDPADNDIPW